MEQIRQLMPHAVHVELLVVAVLVAARVIRDIIVVQLRKTRRNHHLNITLMKTTSAIEVRQRHGQISQLDPIQSSLPRRRFGRGKIVRTPRRINLRKGFDQPRLQRGGSALDQSARHVESVTGHRIQQRAARGVSAALDHRPQRLQRPRRLEAVLGTREQRIHATRRARDRPPHLLVHLQHLVARLLLLGQIFHHPPLSNQQRGRVALPLFGLGHFELLSDFEGGATVGAELFLDFFRLFRGAVG
mmetsp:Transcript_3474/g.7633  ORF Transcript_3474/g.7633 Transcript_3474/m.7633 type:complete len:245 (+) Transcript_3474:2086-2820(+)